MEPIDSIHRTPMSSKAHDEHEGDHDARRESANKQREEYLRENLEDNKDEKESEKEKSEASDQQGKKKPHHHGNDPSLGKEFDMDA